jgi:GNAT superfamily N-acetyltransferase
MVTDVSALPPADRAAIVDLLVAAFFNDPMQSWLFPRPRTRAGHLHRFYDLDIEHRLAGTAQVERSGRHAVGFWHPPGTADPLTASTAARLIPAVRPVLGHHPVKAARVLRGVLQRRPAEAHWYLSHLAVHPDHQGRGHGQRLLRRGIDQAEADGVGVYLETANADNLPFYQASGLHEVGVVRVAGAPTVWSLWWSPIDDRLLEPRREP